MSYFISGKILETLGAILLAYVAIRAGVLEVWIGAPLHRTAEQANGSDLEKLRAGLEAVLARRKRQFGFYEAIAVGIGTLLIAVGCGLYLVGLWIEQH